MGKFLNTYLQITNTSHDHNISNFTFTTNQQILLVTLFMLQNLFYQITINRENQLVTNLLKPLMP